jgi:hypothetical protein
MGSLCGVLLAGNDMPVDVGGDTRLWPQQDPAHAASAVSLYSLVQATRVMAALLWAAPWHNGWRPANGSDNDQGHVPLWRHPI